MTVSEIKRQAEIKFEQAGVSRPVFEANELMMWALGVSRGSLPLHYKDEVPEEAAKLFYDACEKRVSGYPLQYIIGEWEFYGDEYYVGEGVLIPRPDTELLMDIALSGKAPENVADLCSGSGCIAISLAKRIKGTVFAVEKSEKAISYIKKNIEKNGVKNVSVIKGDVLCGNFSLPKLDMLICNPPYLNAKDMHELDREVRFEPEEALYGGEDGLDFYRIIASRWKDAVKEGGKVIFEIGFTQGAAVSELLDAAGCKDISVYKDAAGKERAVTGIV